MIPDLYNAEEADVLGDFAFDFEKQDMISASDRADAIEDKWFNMSSVDQFASDTGLFTQMPAPLPLRPYRSFAKAGDRASPTISGNELRSLEGRRSPGGQLSSLNMPVSSTTTPSSAAPTLRRKSRFGPSTTNAPRYNSNHQISRNPPDGGISEGHRSLQSPELPMSPSSVEWTQRFREQISLHSNSNELLSPQMHGFEDIQRENFKQVNGQMSPREMFQHRKAFSEQAAVGSSYSHLVDYSQQVSHSLPRDVNVPIPIVSTQPPQDSDSSQRIQSSHISNDTFRQHRQTQSWAHAPTNFTSDYTVSPGQIHDTWVHSLPDEPSAYFSNVAYPTPTSQEPPVMFGQEALSTDCYAPSDLPLNPLNHHSSFPNLHTSQEALLNNLANRHPHTPPPSNPSASPPTPEVTPSPQKQTRASARRQSNANTLRLRKSTAALKPAKSLSALKSTKSAGHLRGKKSIGGSGSGGGAGLNNTNHHQHHHQGGSGNTKSPIKKEKSQPSGMNIGFMNFTPNDHHKILTGVAPSGSSKTKARRELEANEERRRLIKAIEIAGGDSEGLKRQLNVKVER